MTELEEIKFECIKVAGRLESAKNAQDVIRMASGMLSWIIADESAINIKPTPRMPND